jgi:uncharacterized coiled-coil DUF342 family protein
MNTDPSLELDELRARVAELEAERDEILRELFLIRTDRDELFADRDRAAARIAALEAERDRLRGALKSLPHEEDCAYPEDECDCVRAALVGEETP